MKRHWILLIVTGSLAGVTLTLAGGLGRAAGASLVVMQDVVINEVAWAGTACSFYDEWIELYNNRDVAVNLDGWTLRAADGSPQISLDGTIPAGGYFLLERQDDGTVSDVPADLIYSGALEDGGERLELRNKSTVLVDTVNADGGDWPGGTNNPDYSMERRVSSLPGGDANWGTNDGLTRNGLDCDGQPINGTPGARNSAWMLPGADLGVSKSGPGTILPGQIITYTVTLSNAGLLPAQGARLTDVLPAHVRFVAHTAPYPLSQPLSDTLVWALGSVPTTTAAAPVTFALAGRVSATALGALTNAITVTSVTTEVNAADNHDVVVTELGGPPPVPVVLVKALYYDGYAAYDHDEAVRVKNTSTVVADVGGWSVTNRAARAPAAWRTARQAAAFPPGTVLAPGQAVWCTRQATAFEQQFGFRPDFETDETDPDVPQMDGSWPLFANDGGECLLRDADGESVDVLVYEDGDTGIAGWIGPAIGPWSPNNYFGAEGQILYRKRDQVSGRVLPDTDTAADWAQDPADHVDGRRVRYPGWDLDHFFWTARVTETAVLTVAVGPDHLLETVLAHVEGAKESIWIGTYTFESGTLAQALVAKLESGIGVTLLLEGSPAGGMAPAQRWICGQIQDAGGQVYFMYNSPVQDRYRFHHAKFMLVDERLALIGTENLNPSGLPADDKGDGTAGRRGVYLITDAPGVVDRVRAILAADVDPAHHGDLVTCADVPALCSGSPPLSEPNWTSYTIAFSQPLAIRADLAFEVVHAPENSLRTVDGLLGLLGRAGSGDTVLIEQFYEHLHWGPGDGTPQADPNLRLAAYVAAARRGATVRILLNSFVFASYWNENEDTAAYLRALARQEGLDLQVRLGNPTHLGLHNKMVLARVGGRGHVHVGSLNGSEVSAKVNRELALQVQSGQAYDYLAAVFDYDWRHSPLFLHLPLVVKVYEAPRPADHLLVSEVFYATTKEGEWVEILNPTSATVDLSDFKIGDAEQVNVFEGMYEFPPGTALAPHQVLVIAVSAAAFRQTYGQAPGFELYETDPTVPTLAPSAVWGTGEWQLRNDGDEVLLLDTSYRSVDAVVYGNGAYLGVVAHPGVSLHTHSLERYPPLLDSDDCNLDFRDWPFPNPGELP